MAHSFEESPFAEEVVIRDYAQQAGPSTGGIDYSPGIATEDDLAQEVPSEDKGEKRNSSETAQTQEPTAEAPPTLDADFIVEDDEDFLRLEALSEKAKAAYQDQDQEMQYVAPTEDADAEVLSSNIHQGIVNGGKSALSEQIYSGLSELVPEALHELSKIRESTFQEQDWSEAIVRTTLVQVGEHNEKQRKKFAWTKLHETQIKHPLRAFLLDKGLENATSPAGQLLIGLVAVALVTFFTFKNVRQQNRTMEQKLIAEVEKLIRQGELRRST